MKEFRPTNGEVLGIHIVSDSVNPNFVLVNKKESITVSEMINSDVFDGVQRIYHDCNSFSQLEINQCYDYLKANGYEPYFKDGFLSAKK